MALKKTFFFRIVALAKVAKKVSRLKKPFLLEVIIYSFLIAPFGNLLTTAALTGREDWYHPRVWVFILQNSPVIDFVWLGSIFAAGILLTLRHRTAWLVAISSLSLTFLINFRNLYQLSSLNSLSAIHLSQILVSLLTTSLVGVLFFYYRYPYLDRRVTLFGFADRVDLKESCHIQLQSSQIQIHCVSLSLTGARFELDQALPLFSNDDTMSIYFDNHKLEVTAVAVQHEVPILRVRFVNLSFAQKLSLKRLMEKASEPSVTADKLHKSAS